MALTHLLLLSVVVLGPAVVLCGSSMEDVALKGHNEHRENAGLKELKWDDSLAKGVGENLYSYGGTKHRDYEAAEMATKSWYAELRDFRFAGGDQSYDACGGSFSHYGHFTQMMWKDTEEVGCGFAECRGPMWNGFVFACQYKPPGNYKGQPLMDDDNYKEISKKEKGWTTCAGGHGDGFRDYIVVDPWDYDNDGDIVDVEDYDHDHDHHHDHGDYHHNHHDHDDYVSVHYESSGAINRCFCLPFIFAIISLASQKINADYLFI